MNYQKDKTKYKSDRLHNMKNILLALCFVSLLSACTKSNKTRDVTVAIVADTHFDQLPETDQYYHIRAINALDDSLTSIGRDLNGIIVAGDLIDKLADGVLDLFKQRYEKGQGDKRPHTVVYPGLGNHDLDPINLAINPDSSYQKKVMLCYMDSFLVSMKAQKKILDYDSSSRTYSWNIQDVHFIQGQRAAGDISYCKSNLAWIEQDLEKYASKGNPVVYIQHYAFDEESLLEWPESDRKQLFDLFDNYNLQAVFVGHTHQVSLQKYAGYTIYQVNNAWKDNDGNGSFAILHITNDSLQISTCKWIDDLGHTVLEAPSISKSLTKN